MKKIKLLSYFITVAIIFSTISINFIVPVKAEEALADNVEQKICANVDINEDFSDSRVLVVFSNEATLELNEYTLEDFSEIDVKEISDLTSATKTKAKAQLEKLNEAFFNRMTIEDEEIESYKHYNQVFCLELANPGKENVISAIKTLQARDDIIYAGPDFPIYTSFDEDNLDLTSSGSTWQDEYAACLELIKLTLAWNISTGSSAIKVGVLDSGIYANHFELNAVIDAELSRDFTNSISTDGVLIDQYGHGTNVAGIIGSQGLVLEGVCQAVTLVSLKVFDHELDGFASDLAEAINYAEDNGIPILNFSGRWGEYQEGFNLRYNYPLEQVLETYNGLFVCAAGNELKDIDHCDVFPANLELPNILVVGASDENDQSWHSTYVDEYDIEREQGSNTGKENVDIFAPGSNVWCLSNSGGIVKRSGTSMATPFVTGVAALMLAHNPNLKPHEIKCIIMRNIDCCVGQFDEDDNDISHPCCNGNCHTCTCDDGVPCENCIGAFKDDCVSGGRLNAYKALSDAIQGHYYACDLEGTTHSVYCEYCGYVCEEVADFGTCANTGSALTHRVWCDSCEMEYDAPHRFAYTNISATSGHTATCEDCGYACTQAHTITSYTNLGTLLGHKAACNKCDYSCTEAHSWTISGGVNMCRYCGALRSLGPGLEIMSGEDEEETE